MENGEHGLCGEHAQPPVEVVTKRELESVMSQHLHMVVMTALVKVLTHRPAMKT